MYLYTRPGHLLSDFAQLPVLPLAQLAVKDANPHAWPHWLRRDQASTRGREHKRCDSNCKRASLSVQQRGGTQDSPGEVSRIRKRWDRTEKEQKETRSVSNGQGGEHTGRYLVGVEGVVGVVEGEDMSLNV